MFILLTPAAAFIETEWEMLQAKRVLSGTVLRRIDIDKVIGDTSSCHWRRRSLFAEQARLATTDCRGSIHPSEPCSEQQTKGDVQQSMPFRLLVVLSKVKLSARTQSAAQSAGRSAVRSPTGLLAERRMACEHEDGERPAHDKSSHVEKSEDASRDNETGGFSRDIVGGVVQSPRGL